jgi:hypothetical protein
MSEHRFKTRGGNFESPYRLGDMIRFRGLWDTKLGAVFHYKNWPNSIVSKYFKTQGEFLKSEFIPYMANEPHPHIDLESLAKIVNEFPENLEPKGDELVVHLRVGDIVDGSDLSVRQILEGRKSNLPKGGHLDKTMTLSFYESLSLEKLGISKIILMIGSSTHNVRNHRAAIAAREKQGKNSKSKKYINIIKRFFEKSGYLVETRSGFSPDEDFVFACRAKMFIPSRSGFAIVIEEVRKHLKKTDVSVRGFGYGIGKSSN